MCRLSEELLLNTAVSYSESESWKLLDWILPGTWLEYSGHGKN